MVKFNYKGYHIVDVYGKKNAIEVREHTTDGDDKVHSVTFTDDPTGAIQKAKEWVDKKKEPKVVKEVDKVEPMEEDTVFTDEKEL